MDKKREIKVLQSLKGDTYFAQFFGTQDIDQMCENIKNDFAIEKDCQFYQKTAILQQRLVKLSVKMDEIYPKYAMGLIDDFGGDVPKEIQGRLYGTVGMLFVIEYKRKKGYRPTECEIDWMVRELKNMGCMD